MPNVPGEGRQKTVTSNFHGDPVGVRYRDIDRITQRDNNGPVELKYRAL